LLFSHWFFCLGAGVSNRHDKYDGNGHCESVHFMLHLMVRYKRTGGIIAALILFNAERANMLNCIGCNVKLTSLLFK